MKCQILHESAGRIRIHAVMGRMSLHEADLLEYYLKSVDGVTAVRVFDRTCDAIIVYRSDRSTIIRALAGFSFSKASEEVTLPEETGRALEREYEERVLLTAAAHYLRRIFVPAPIRHAFAVIRSWRYIRKGAASLLSGRIEVSVLDATAIAASLLRGDFQTASSVMFLLRIGEILEEWTHKKSVGDLARSMSLAVENVWLKKDGTEISVPIRNVSIGDEIVVRMGSMIPLDGVVTEGEMTVNQASMTGESVPVPKSEGAYCYAGCVVEEGECTIRVARTQGTGRYDQIVRMIEESEKLKSSTETKAYHLADKLVPWSLGGTALTYLLTRNVNRALSFLMVDFSCALKLAMPLSVLSAIREARDYQISVKGGKFMEAVAEADTIVFDKTGTLTHATPKVTGVIPFGGFDENEALRLAACLEEHYPHSMANAVVEAALNRELNHEEKHSKVEYVVAHGIASSIDGKKALIGSRHFIFEDEKVTVPQGEEDRLAAIPDHASRLYLAVGGVLAAVILVEDPIREEARDVIAALHDLGISKIAMMTGDNKDTTRAAVQHLDIDEFHAEVLPSDKADFIRSEHAAGRKVIMIGDGVNDTPALSEADCGIAISEGAAIAREIADITIASDNLMGLVTLRRLSMALMGRIQGNYRRIMSFNGALIALGVLGILPPATSALLHNVSTIAIGVGSTRNLLTQER